MQANGLTKIRQYSRSLLAILIVITGVPAGPLVLVKDDHPRPHGCLHFAPGTHRWGMLNGRQLEPFLPDLDDGRWPSVPVPLRAGSVSFHHSLTLHSSGPNHSAKRRRGYAVHYMRATSIKDEAVTDVPAMPPFKQVRGNSFPGRV